MTVELSLIASVVLLLGALLWSLWRSAGMPREDFFPSQRERLARNVRLRACALFGVALAALAAQFAFGQKQVHLLEQKEQRLLQYQAEVLRLRVDYQLARDRLQAAQTALVHAAMTPDKAPASEMAEVAVSRAVVRDAPAGAPRFVLTGGTRVELRGSSQDDEGREWREALTDDGRAGWMATELLNAVSG
jgi:hypothetical protein